MRKIVAGLLFLLISILVCRDRAHATTFGFTGLCSGVGCNQTESAQAVFTLNAATDTITIQINDLLANSTSDIQAINALGFTLDQSLNATLNSGATATLLTNITHTSFGSQLGQPTGWGLLGSAGNFTLCAVNNGNCFQHDHTIIGGPDAGGDYSNANGSITNHNHDPFLESGVSFNINVPGLTESNVVTGATFFFGTAADQSGQARCIADCAPTGKVPEPSTFILLGSGLLIISAVGRKLRFAQSV